MLGNFSIKGNTQFLEKVTFEPFMDFKQNHYRSRKYYKTAIFKSLIHLGYKNTQLLFLWTAFFNIFMRQTLTNDFCVLHKNMNCAFPSVMFECIFGFDIDRKFHFNR